jgi:hypothetical protein
MRFHMALVDAVATRRVDRVELRAAEAEVGDVAVRRRNDAGHAAGRVADLDTMSVAPYSRSSRSKRMIGRHHLEHDGIEVFDRRVEPSAAEKLYERLGRLCPVCSLTRCLAVS